MRTRLFRILGSPFLSVYRKIYTLRSRNKLSPPRSLQALKLIDRAIQFILKCSFVALKT